MDWLTALAWLSLGLGFVSALAVAIDVRNHPQHMWIMNVVWPITALYSGPLGWWAYHRMGRAADKHPAMAMHHGAEGHGPPKPFWQQVVVATTHCGSGCTLGDIVAEWMMVAFPFVLFGRRLYAAWVVDFVWAYALGIVFQYFTIAPMRHLSVGKGILAAVRADTLSLTAWQIGMYG
jgi:hypothetical protein